MKLHDLTPAQVMLIRNMKKQYEESKGKRLCDGINCVSDNCPIYKIKEILCNDKDKEERYRAICKYLTELDKPNYCTEIKEIKERLAKLEEERQHPMFQWVPDLTSPIAIAMEDLNGGDDIIISNGKAYKGRDKPEIIQNVMHWNGKDYLKMPDKDYSCAPYKKHPEPDRDTEGLIWFECNGWKDFNDIKITDALARSRTDEQPIWVKCKDVEDGMEDIDKLLGVSQCISYKYCCETANCRYCRLATVADLKKAGIK